MQPGRMLSRSVPWRTCLRTRHGVTCARSATPSPTVVVLAWLVVRTAETLVCRACSELAAHNASDLLEWGE